MFERPRPARNSRRWIATLVVLTLVLAVSGMAAWRLAPSTSRPLADRIPGVALDSDQDGILDQAEIAGWRTQAGLEYVTDPYDSDTDGDGLSDGEEAGPPSSETEGDATYAGRSDPTAVDSDDDGLSDAVETGEITSTDESNGVYFLVSNPLVADSDEDTIGDGDEFFFDMDPLAADTDGDGLPDPDELDFGSDPTLANPDEDSYTDKEEQERGSNPLSYDLDGNEKVAARKAGLKYGDCFTCAQNAGLKDEQIESAEYLLGHLASGVMVYGDLRDFGVSLWERRFVAAGLAALALVPYIGDGTKVFRLVTDFAKRGDRAAEVGREVTSELPLPTSIKQKILASLPSRAGKLPRELRGGPKDHVVYVGQFYVGITKDFDRRKSQHAKAGRAFVPERMTGATSLSRGEARAIEEACIVQGGLAGIGKLENRRHSISPTLPYYKEAVAYGNALLKKIGGTCPATMTR